MDKQTTNLGFFEILALIFIALKLTGNIDWSWLWVLSPIWIPLALIVFIAVLAALISEEK